MWGDPHLHDSPPPLSSFFGGEKDVDPELIASCVFNVQGTTFFLKPRYKPRKILGRGAFGVVW
jgi:hypothetical protein